MLSLITICISVSCPVVNKCFSFLLTLLITKHFMSIINFYYNKDVTITYLRQTPCPCLHLKRKA